MPMWSGKISAPWKKRCGVSLAVLLLLTAASADGAEQHLEASESLQHVAASASRPHADATVSAKHEAAERAAAAVPHASEPLHTVRLPADNVAAAQQAVPAEGHAHKPLATAAAPAPEQHACLMPGLQDLLVAAASMQSRMNSGSVSAGSSWQPAAVGDGICIEPTSRAAAQRAEQAAAQAAEAAHAAAAAPAEGVEEDDDVHDRHNFASAKDGAKVLAVNKEAKRAPAVLDNDGDTFMRTDCKADKWLIIELPQVIRPDKLQVSQHELYSSRIKDFEVRGRQKHPRHDAASGASEPGSKGVDYTRSLNSAAWKLVGNFTAAKTKGTQSFKVDNPPWVKYLLLRFLTHHGSEPVCTINDIAVYGKSAAEDLEDRLGDDEGEGPTPAAAADPALLILPPTPAVVPPPPTVPPPVATPPQQAAADAPQQPAPAGAPPQASGAASHAAGVAAGTSGHPDEAPLAAGTAQSEPTVPTAQQVAAPHDAQAAATTQPQQQPPVAAVVVEPGGPPVPGADQPAVQPEVSAAQRQVPPTEPVLAQPTTATVVGAGPAHAQLAAAGIAANVSDASMGSPRDAAAVLMEGAGKVAASGPQVTFGGQPAAAQVTPKLVAADGEDKEFPLQLQSSRLGKSVYDLLVEEIKAIKVQQKLQPRQVAELQSSMAAATAEVAALKQRLHGLESAVELGARPPQLHTAAPDQLLNLTAQVNVLRAQLQAGRRREVGFLCLWAGLAALALPRLNLGRFGGTVRTAMLALAAASGFVGLANYTVSYLAEGLPTLRFSDLGLDQLKSRPPMPALPLQLLT